MFVRSLILSLFYYSSLSTYIGLYRQIQLDYKDYIIAFTIQCEVLVKHLHNALNKPDQAIERTALR